MKAKHIFLTMGLTLLSPMLALAQGWRGNSDCGYNFHNFFGGGWMMILWIALLIGIVILIMKRGVGSSPKRVASNNAMNILMERYAKGEISREDYLKLKDDLD